MSETPEAPERPGLTPSQITAQYEAQLNRAIPLSFFTGFVLVVAAILIAFFLGNMTGLIIGIVIIVLGGFVQKLVILRVRCPSCGARVLGRIYSIVQVRNIRECPRCNVKLRE
jgi:hypothetical protein